MTEHSRDACPYYDTLDAIATDLDEPTEGVPGLLTEAITICAFVGSLSDEGFGAWWPILRLKGGETAEAVLLGQEATGHLSVIMRVQAYILRRAQQRLRTFLDALIAAEHEADPRKAQEGRNGHGHEPGIAIAAVLGHGG
jgi:hypothetical protein